MIVIVLRRIQITPPSFFLSPCTFICHALCDKKKNNNPCLFSQLQHTDTRSPTRRTDLFYLKLRCAEKGIGHFSKHFRLPSMSALYLSNDITGLHHGSQEAVG